MATVPDTRERIVEAARHLFWEKGYAATSLADLLDKAGANSGSFYYFFESKDALLRTVLDGYLDLLEPQLLRPAWEASADPLERVFALLDRYRQALVQTDCAYGCPIGRLALEIDAENAPAQQRIVKNFAAWKRAVEVCLRAAGVPQPAAAASLVLAVMEGGVMQARAHRSIEPFDASVRQLRNYLEGRRPRREKRRKR